MNDNKRVIILPNGGRRIIEDLPLSDAAQDAIEQGLAQEEYDYEHKYDGDWPDEE